MEDHPDLFGEMPIQPNLVEPPGQRRPLTGDDIKHMMLTLIARARSADTMPFEPNELRRHVSMFPIMAQWLPPEEGEQLVLEFEREVERLRNAA